MSARRPRGLGALALGLAALLLGGACGSDNKVGDESILNFEEQVNEGLGNTTTTAAPAATGATTPGGAPVTTATTAPAGGTQGTATTATTRPATVTTKAVVTTTTAPQEQVLEITIQGDAADKPVDPDYGRAYVGTTIRWINKDTVARSVAATTGEFKSPSIPPGGSFDYKATKVGIFDYGDGTRPYVNATLEILEGRVTHLRRLLGALVLVSTLAASAACGRSDASAEPVAGKRVKSLELKALPAQLLGLEVRKEDVTSTVAKVDATYLAGLGLWSLRKIPEPGSGGGDLVQATLQVSRFNAAARPKSSDFRQTVVNQIGSTKPKAFRLGARTVYLTTGTKQSIAVWFRGDYLFILASRADFDQPRTLLRAALEVEP